MTKLCCHCTIRIADAKYWLQNPFTSEVRWQDAPQFWPICTINTEQWAFFFLVFCASYSYVRIQYKKYQTIINRFFIHIFCCIRKRLKVGSFIAEHEQNPTGPRPVFSSKRKPAQFKFSHISDLVSPISPSLSLPKGNPSCHPSPGTPATALLCSAMSSLRIIGKRALSLSLSLYLPLPFSTDMVPFSFIFETNACFVDKTDIAVNLTGQFLSIRFQVLSKEADCFCCFVSDGMFKGIYNGRQCHVTDIPAVLSRAWTAGVDRIIVLSLSPLSATHLYIYWPDLTWPVHSLIVHAIIFSFLNAGDGWLSRGVQRGFGNFRDWWL